MSADLRWMLPLVSRHLDGLPVGLFLRGRGRELPVRWASAGIARVTGYASSLLEADPGFWLGRVHPEDRSRVAAAYRALEPGETTGITYRLLEADGGERWLREEVRAEPALEGESGVYVGIVRDVTGEVRTAREVDRLEERIRRSERGESLGGLAAGIAHDFNNLLTAIISTAQILRDEAGEASGLEADLRLIEDAARRGERLIRRIVGFAGRPHQEPEDLDLREVVEETLPLLERTLGEDVHLEVVGDPAPWPVRADPALVEQVVVNLAVNARDAMPGGGRVEIAVTNDPLDRRTALERFGVVPGDFVRLTVRDVGEGIPPEDRERIFEPYFSTKGSDRVGAGIGLSTVRRIARDHGGGVEVESDRGLGTAVHVLFPRSAAGTGKSEERRRGGGGPLGRRLYILLVDDDDAVRQAAARALGREGHRVLTARTAVQAIDRFSRSTPPPELLVTDVVLPDRTGPELHRVLAARSPGLPVLYISGYSWEELELRTRVSSRDRVLRKPFDPGSLRRAIREVLREGGSARDGTRNRG